MSETERHGAALAAAAGAGDLAAKASALHAGLTGLAEALAPPPPQPVVGKWGKGPATGRPWFSGVRYAGGSLNGAWAWPADIHTAWAPSQDGITATWDLIAGGVGDDPTLREGPLTWTKGTKMPVQVWTDPRLTAKPLVYIVPIVPDEASNANGQRPETWLELATGARDDVFRRLGRRFAHHDARFPRARMILELAHEFTGGWYRHSIHGAVGGVPCWQLFPPAWARIVRAFRDGYKEIAGADCPYLFWLRPARSMVAEGVRTLDLLPPLGTWDGIGISQHDNKGATQCSPDNPRANWTTARRHEGLLSIAEIAERTGKPIGIWEWASARNTSDGATAGPYPDVFTRSMWDFCREHRHLLAGETYFLSGDSDFGGENAAWPGAVAYRETFGEGVVA